MHICAAKHAISHSNEREVPGPSWSQKWPSLDHVRQMWSREAPMPRLGLGLRVRVRVRIRIRIGFRVRVRVRVRIGFRVRA